MNALLGLTVQIQALLKSSNTLPTFFCTGPALTLQRDT